jgi:tripeptide aminopeptidase
VRRASEAERRRLNETFAALCAIPSPSGDERACADAVTAQLRELGLEVTEDGAAAATGAGAGNLLVRLPTRGRTPERTILLCAHLDTVGVEGPIEPVVEEGLWINRHAAILGADNKAAVAILVELARRVAAEGSPVGVELLFTVSEEVGLLGARAFDTGVLQSAFGYVFDHASPIGDVIIAAPTHYRLEAVFHGQSAHAGVRPEDGRSAVLAAARAIASMPLGRIDAGSTANVASLHGGGPGTNVVPDSATLVGECRALDDDRAEALIAELVDRIHDAANDPSCPVDVDVMTERQLRGYRLRETDPAVHAARRALGACGYAAQLVPTGGASDANALIAAGLPVVNLADGTQRNHQPDECVPVAALEGMLDVALALLDAAAEVPS